MDAPAPGLRRRDCLRRPNALTALAASSPHRPQRRPCVLASRAPRDRGALYAGRALATHCHCPWPERSRLFRADSLCQGPPCRASPPSPSPPQVLLRRASLSSRSSPELRAAQCLVIVPCHTGAVPHHSSAPCCTGGSRSSTGSRSWY